jgi:hypothetical protein
MARTTTISLIALAALVASCGKDSGAGSKGSVASSLTKGIDFEGATLFDAPMPATTDNSVSLMPLGPTPVLHPGIGGIMALEVDDPSDRDVVATLMQFGGDDSHIRVPVTDNQTGDVVENQYDLDAKLCTVLCDAIFTITIRQKVEFKGGKISKAAARKVVLDCRKTGDHDACGGAPGPGADIEVDEQLCGDVTAGEIALSGDVVLDTHLDAVRQLQLIGGAIDTQVTTALSSMAGSLGLPDDSSAEDIANALSMRLMQETQSGLTLLQGDQGCAVRLAQVGYALLACDPDGVASLKTIDCTGVCEPQGDDVSVCADAETSGCRGMLEEDECTGICLGACQIELASAGPCAGTCIGSCAGTCPDDGKGGCSGPCDGDCTGTCRQTSTSSCDGACTGVCSSSASGEPMCEAPLASYCSSASDAALACPGDCFGEAALQMGAAKCRASALAIGRILPRCTPPLVQLSFGFGAMLDGDAQAALATLVQKLNGPLAKLSDAAGRLALLSAAAADLQEASQGDIADQLDMQLDANPKDKGIVCAKKQLAAAGTWLDGEAGTLAALQAQIDLIFAVVNIAQ